jgi:phosphatidylserine/phosphatidylglycerophosphate/cardiolipin synthase-like enzyme
MGTMAAFSRTGSLAKLMEREIRALRQSLDGALYRFNNPALAAALAAAAVQGVQVRLVLDESKYRADPVTRSLLHQHQLPFRRLRGRSGSASKMHHKFAILDNRSVVTGSYNWTLESEQENYESLLVLRDPALVQPFRKEFEALWTAAEPSD